MHIIRFVTAGGDTHWGIPHEDGTATVLEGTLPGPMQPTGRRLPIASLRCPLTPRAILAVGLNYRDHATETGQPLPERPVLFMKNPAAAWHPEAPIRLLPEFVARPEVDFEGELAVILGRSVRDVAPDEALAAVFGYTVANDVSARRVQKQAGGGQWVRGKSFDTFCPLGPAVVTADEVPDPQRLRLRTHLNGVLMQDSSTAEMIFSVAELIADLSRGTTLLAGTVLLTGTPAGVGFVRSPRVFLKPGDVISVEIEHIGVLRNPVEAAR